MDIILPQADDWGPTRLEEVFIKELHIFWVAKHSNNVQEIGQVWVHKVLSNNMQLVLYATIDKLEISNTHEINNTE
jgi:hypothetical protein